MFQASLVDEAGIPSFSVVALSRFVVPDLAAICVPDTDTPPTPRLDAVINILVIIYAVSSLITFIFSVFFSIILPVSNISIFV